MQQEVYIEVGGSKVILDADLNDQEYAYFDIKGPAVKCTGYGCKMTSVRRCFNRDTHVGCEWCSTSYKVHVHEVN